MSESAAIKISSHNINGFAGSKDFLHHRCEAEDKAIFAVQEHWLKPAFRNHLGVNQLRSVHSNYEGYGTSAMKEKTTTTVTKGRPFGGTGFIYSKSLNYVLKPKCEYRHERVSVMSLQCEEFEILIINAYLPYYDVSNLNDQLLLYNDTIGYIDYIMMSNPDCQYILTMDMNCDIYNSNNAFSLTMRDFIAKYDLISTHDLNPNFDSTLSFTRCDVKRNSYTLIDGILISRPVCPLVTESNIAHYGNNTSDHSPVEITINVKCKSFSKPVKSYSSYIPWNSLEDEEISNYEFIMDQELNSISIPNSVLHGCVLCTENEHCNDLEKYYSDIVNAIFTADKSLPRRKHGIAKPFWSSELSDLKRRSIDACNLWKLAGCPRSGDIFREKCRANVAYKSAIRSAKKVKMTEKNDSLYLSLSSRDTNTFWRNYKKLNGKVNNACRIDGYVDDAEIANSFKNTFSKVYANGNRCSENLRRRFHEAHALYSASHITENLDDYFFSWNDMLDALSKMSIGKASSGSIKSQHIFLGSPKLSIHLNILFNGLLQHSYVPYDFLQGTVTPVVKDKEGDINDSSNYRLVTLSLIFSQLLERLLLIKIGRLLHTDDLQFGFKARHSTSHAVFVLKSCVDYFVNHGSNTFVTFLDCTKAFDVIPHEGIFLKLIQKGVPLCYINFLIYWYSNMRNRCRWNNALSDEFPVPSGMKQGGILSPRLFIVYIDELLTRLRKSGVGCYFIDMFIGALLFADDLCLIAPTRGAMQILLGICQEFCTEFGLTFNPKKSKAMFFGKGQLSPCPLYLNNEPIQFVSEWRYLGLFLQSGKNVTFSPNTDLRNFYASFNSLFNAYARPSETVLMQLLYSTCIPNLTYAADVKVFTSNEMSKNNTAVNDAIRKIFTFNRWESIRDFRAGLGYPDLYTIFAKRRTSFHSKLPYIGNSVLKHMSEFMV